MIPTTSDDWIETVQHTNGAGNKNDVTVRCGSAVTIPAEILGEIRPLDEYIEDDGGNSEIFDRYGEGVRYSHARESWFVLGRQ